MLIDMKVDCPECGGAGEVEYEIEVPMSNSNSFGDYEVRWCECQNCFGSGVVEVEHDD